MTLYIDCFSGISGDMALGALIDLGISSEYLIEELKKLNVDGYEIKVSEKFKNGIRGIDVDIIIANEHHCENHPHEHHEEHSCENHPHEHHHRSYQDIKELITNSELNENVKELSKKMFFNIGTAEAKIHGKSLDEVHFHEVGAIDSIVDIVGVAICIDKLNIKNVISSALHVGTGTTWCQHGIIPIPAPATLEILKEGKVPFYSKGVDKEMVTPTGATIVATLSTQFGNMPECNVTKIGYGCGKRDMKIANMVRMMIINEKKKIHQCG